MTLFVAVERRGNAFRVVRRASGTPMVYLSPGPKALSALKRRGPKGADAIRLIPVSSEGDDFAVTWEDYKHLEVTWP